MSRKNHRLTLAAALAASLVAGTAQAGGPLFLGDSGQPLAWDVSTPVKVYTDLGDLCDTDGQYPHYGCLTNEQADAAVAFGFEQWSSVPTSSFGAGVAGDFADIGLGDITGANAGDVIGTWNGGGYHVMYDADGSIIRDFYGAPGGVLGISSPEYAEGDVITESWAIINAAAVPQDDDGTRTAGVMTHEFGHGINLSHSQANGHITFLGSPWYWIAWAPQRCAAPYDVSVIEDWNEYQDWIFDTAIPNTETMYPYIRPDATGVEMSTVDRPDDVTAVSNLYPADGWPASHGIIAGEILLKDGQTGLTGVNVVARRIDDPLGQVVTVMSGDQTQGTLGPDGRFTLSGLSDGQWVLYVENIYAGGFPTPPATLPSFQEYYNGSGESTNAATDDPCAWDVIEISAGKVVNADIAFNGIERAPTFVQIPVPAATDVDNSGRRISGTYGGQAVWHYDVKSGEFEAFAARSGAPKLTRDGHTTALNLNPDVPPWEGGVYQPALWNRLTGLTMMDMPHGETGCDGVIMSPYDVDAQGKTVVGLAYQNGCSRPAWSNSGLNKFYGATWTKAAGLEYLETPDWVLPEMQNCTYDFELGGYVEGCQVSGSRANAIAGDSTLIVGHVDAGGWKGSAWVDGEFMMMGQDDPKGWVGSANGVNHDGTAVVGGYAGRNDWDWGEDAYVWSPETGTRNLGHFTLSCEIVAPWDCPWMPEIVFPAEAFGVSDKGDIVVGRAGDFWNGFIGFLWMEELGMLDFNEFLQGQGVMEAYTSGLISPLAISGDGKTIVGWGYTDIDQISFAVTLDQVWMCSKGKSQMVGFPGAAISHLKRGAELGLCEVDRPIKP